MEKQEALRRILIDANCPETGDVIVDKICELFGYADTNKFVLTDAKTAEEARQQAIDWQQWASGEHLQLSYEELATFAEHFTKLANKFNLTEEFRENGII
jgi:hypothetical protein